MDAVIRKWGNSNGILLPKSILDALSIKTNDAVTIEQKDDSIVIRKAQNPHVSLEERLVEFYNKPINAILQEEAAEIDWGSPVGDEVW